MKFNEPTVRSSLAASSEALGSSRSPEATARVVAYVELLCKWSRRISLVRFDEVDQLVARHIADALAASRHLPDGANTLVDVGAGAGLPGAVLAAIRPALEVTALEPVRKKHAFLAAARRGAPLPNLVPLAERLEDAVARGARFDAAISRATWPVPEWLARAEPLVVDGGTILGMEGRQQHELPERAVRHGYRLGSRERAIVVLPRGD